MINDLPRKIKILHCIETISSGGVEVVRLGFVKHFDKSKYELRIICTNARGPIKRALENEGVIIYEVGAFTSPFEINKYKQVVSIVKEYSPHIIHGAVFEGMCMASIGGLIGQVPVTILEETSDPINRSFKAVWLQRQLAKISNAVIGISPSVTYYLKNVAKIPSSKVVLINNGVDNFNLQFSGNNVSRNLLGIDDSDYVLGAVGRVYDDVKRFSDILSALVIINNPKIKFLLVGDGPDLTVLKKMAVDLGIQMQFISVGFQENTSGYYKLMDCFCVPSAHEGFGMVAVEAMFHKLPVIASAVGGLKDVVLNHITGLLIPPENPKTLAVSICHLIENVDESQLMGMEGFKRADEIYGILTYTQKLINLYQDLLREKLEHH